MWEDGKMRRGDEAIGRQGDGKVGKRQSSVRNRRK
jgi:hypothetical protein